ncbi:hypothetical protein Prudu_020288 [Prunus dulcis]|uniref:Uncharacterized protein n=1 Tax=Prunus dulcis TaxID=3755 RepID=A0A4Y1RUX2_PRUDU|nr:hypothetical protein Prudu_020288 [Prunus dulcis]
MGHNSYCYFHPKEVVVGVCSLCLTERLLILAANKGHHVSSARGRASAHRTPSGMHKKPPISLPRSLRSALSSIDSGSQITWIKRPPPAKKLLVIMRY